MILTACEKTALSADIAAVAHPSSAQIQRATNTSDGAGGRTRAFSTVTTVMCRVTPQGGAEGERSDRMRDKEAYKVAFAAGTDIRIDDRIVVDGLTLSVEERKAPASVEIERIVMASRAAV